MDSKPDPGLDLADDEVLLGHLRSDHLGTRLANMAHPDGRPADELRWSHESQHVRFPRAHGHRHGQGAQPPPGAALNLNGQVLVNRASWSGPPLPDGLLVVNAPRPLRCAGDKEWTGPFRHGIFYAAGPDPAALPGGPERESAVSRVEHWRAYDAWLVVFTVNDEIEQLVLAHLTAHGYADAGMTIAELAGEMGLPWHEESVR